MGSLLCFFAYDDDEDDDDEDEDDDGEDDPFDELFDLELFMLNIALASVARVILGVLETLPVMRKRVRYHWSSVSTL